MMKKRKITLEISKPTKNWIRHIMPSFKPYNFCIKQFFIRPIFHWYRWNIIVDAHLLYFLQYQFVIGPELERLTEDYCSIFQQDVSLKDTLENETTIATLSLLLSSTVSLVSGNRLTLSCRIICIVTCFSQKNYPLSFLLLFLCISVKCRVKCRVSKTRHAPREERRVCSSSGDEGGEVASKSGLLT